MRLTLRTRGTQAACAVMPCGTAVAIASRIHASRADVIASATRPSRRTRAVSDRLLLAVLAVLGDAKGKSEPAASEELTRTVFREVAEF